MTEHDFKRQCAREPRVQQSAVHMSSQPRQDLGVLKIRLPITVLTESECSNKISQRFTDPLVSKILKQ